MNKNFIWDFDGTLFDSYESIISSLYELYHDLLKIDVSKDEIYYECIKGTVREYTDKLEKKYGIKFLDYENEYKKIKANNYSKIILYKFAREIVEYFNKNGDKNFIITHRGESTYLILNKFNMENNFIEVITKNSGFARKPSPESINYLIDKYNLDRKNTYYIGDREIDINAAKNANIKSIYFKSNSCDISPNESADITIDSLNELIDIFK